MEGLSLGPLVDEHLAIAREHGSGRSAVTIHGGREHHLRQTLIALASGRALGEHESPGEATLQVLRGRVRLHAGDDEWQGVAGDFVLIPSDRHDLAALEDAAVLLTVTNRLAD
jgi:quercetin dioxygenase-like cupin family protein